MVRCRLIPARAGKTGRVRRRRWCRGAHPRACGENVDPGQGRTPLGGSSPRVRGKRPLVARDGPVRGLIPACAGKTRATGPPARGPSAHPRVCGENHGKAENSYDPGLIPARAGKTGPVLAACSRARAHPRVCGENAPALTGGEQCGGSSPRVRGKLGDLVPALARVRLIPACAGKTPARTVATPRPWAHPRVCGENEVGTKVTADLEGSSPRVRGKPGVRHPPGRPPGLIPACAGKTLATPAMLVCLGAHPRVCGENTRGRTMSRPVPGSSPRVRGKPRAGLQEAARRGLIPACAGKTSCGSARSSSPRAHPRVCGENT